MKINIDFDSARDDPDELMRLAQALGGTAISTGTVTTTSLKVGDSLPIPESIRLPESERLLAQAAAARAAPASDEQDDADGPATELTMLDKSGVPWDARIHSTPGKINKSDGMWRAKRNADEVEAGRIHAELAALHAPKGTGTESTGTASADGDSATADAPAPPPPADDPNDRPAPPPPADTENVPTAQQPAGNAQGGGGRFDGFASFVQSINGIKSPNIPYAQLNDTAVQLGVADFKSMKDHPDKWEDFYILSGGV